MSDQKRDLDPLLQRMTQLEEENSRLKKENDQLQIYRKIFEILPIGVTVCVQENPDDLGSFRFIVRNPASTEMDHFPNEMILEKTIREALPKLLETEIPSIFAEVIRTQQSQLLPEFQYGNDQILEDIFSVKIVPLGRSFVGILFENITEEKRAEEALQTQMKKLEERVEARTIEIQKHLAEINHIYNTAPVGLAFLSPDLKYIRVNEMLANINGKPVSDHLNKSYQEVIPELVPYIKPHFNQILETKEPILNIATRNAILAQPDVERDWVVNYYPVHDNSTFLGIGVIIQDVTELKELESQLHQSQKMDALGTLAGGIAHEFNNILAVILGNAELCLSRLPEDGQDKLKGNLQRIIESGDHGANLIRQILTFSRMKAANLESVNLPSVVKDALEMIRPLTPANIKIDQDLPEDALHIMADETQIHQILMNLCSNASHAMKETGGRLEVSLKVLEKSDLSEASSVMSKDPCLKLTVKDTGPGISPEIQTQIFDPFFTTKGVGEGTGLGLAVVHGIVKQHQGKITVEGERGKGTTFSLFFPILREDSIEAGVQETSTKKSIFEKGTGHLLIAEDELHISDTYKTFLEDLGYVVTTCGNGSEALRLFKENPYQFDLVFTDQAMAEMTGKQLTQEILKLRPGIPIILATGYSEVLTEEEARELGILHYLKKPFHLSTLQKSIAECLKEND